MLYITTFIDDDLFLGFFLQRTHVTGTKWKQNIRFYIFFYYFTTIFKS